MLGFNASTSVARTHSTFGPGQFWCLLCMYCINITSCLVSTDFSLYSPRCRGSELSLFDCKDYYNRDCSANEGAGVICEYEPPSDTIVELVGGNDTVGDVLIDGKPIW